MKALLLFPIHMISFDKKFIESFDIIIYAEDYLYFKQYAFHKQKVCLHRASMKSHAHNIIEKGIRVHYIESNDLTTRSSLRHALSKLKLSDITTIDPVDDYLSRDIQKIAKDIPVTIIDSPLFLNTNKDLSIYQDNHAPKKPKMAHFYEYNRTRDNILIEDNLPIGGKWSFDSDNRKKIPKGEPLPESTFDFDIDNSFWQEAIAYTEKYFSKNVGNINSEIRHHPINHIEALSHLHNFLHIKIRNFGAYEDAIHTDNNELWHSGLSSCLNNGLLSPETVIKSTLSYWEKYKDTTPYSSVEGFIRQIIGWREFMRYMYMYHGQTMRTRNFWNHTKAIPKSWYDGTTGIDPVDNAIKHVQNSAYNHHIQRLMILGNTMLLSEFKPNDVYIWFMEYYIDAYDWVMVPNVYGMSQFADGGIFATKPYICASNYILKMSNFKKGPWCEELDTLFWSFLKKHKPFLSKNPRLAMLLGNKRAQ